MRRGPPSPEVTILLRAWNGCDKHALDSLTPLVYRELHQIAGSLMGRQRPNHTLQATALVNEAYVRLVDARTLATKKSPQEFAPAACGEPQVRNPIDLNLSYNHRALVKPLRIGRHPRSGTRPAWAVPKPKEQRGYP